MKKRIRKLLIMLFVILIVNVKTPDAVQSVSAAERTYSKGYINDMETVGSNYQSSNIQKPRIIRKSRLRTMHGRQHRRAQRYFRRHPKKARRK